MPTKTKLPPRVQRAIEIAYGNLCAHDNEYGNNEYVDEATRQLEAVLGKRKAREIAADVEREYEGSGMELGDVE